ncbi:MAG TPA: hypothetical protein VEB21_17010 [Terriglobales bacterium]|nr:hypothetical protein [Terriglobales bacterium]
MTKMFVCDQIGALTADIEVEEPGLVDALEHEKADPVIRCALLMAVSSLAQGGSWPVAALESMAGFMQQMRDQVVRDRMH